MKNPITPTKPSLRRDELERIRTLASASAEDPITAKALSLYLQDQIEVLRLPPPPADRAWPEAEAVVDRMNTSAHAEEPAKTSLFTLLLRRLGLVPKENESSGPEAKTADRISQAEFARTTLWTPEDYVEKDRKKRLSTLARVEEGAPNWGHELFFRLRESADSADLPGIDRAIARRAARSGDTVDPEVGMAISNLYFFPADSVVRIAKKYLKGPYAPDAWKLLLRSAILSAHPEQHDFADLEIYGQKRGMIAPDHPLRADRDLQGYIARVVKSEDRSGEVFFQGGVFTWARDLMGMIPSRAFEDYAKSYLETHRDDPCLEGMSGCGDYLRMLEIGLDQASPSDYWFYRKLDEALGARLEAMNGPGRERHSRRRRAQAAIEPMRQAMSRWMASLAAAYIPV